MSEKLKQHLAERSVEVLKPLLGGQFVKLLEYVGQEALAPAVMAATIITSRGAAEILKDSRIVGILIDHLSDADAIHLCTALSQPVEMPKATLRQVDFKRENFARTLFEWYGVPYPDKSDTDGEPSRRASSSWKLRTYQGPAYRQLRHELNRPGNSVLVHMPFGAGKLRSVVTAVLDAFRSERDDGNILWLAPDDCLAEEAVSELETVWRQIGHRDVTIYTLFGGRKFPMLDDVSNAIVVADIESFEKGMRAWIEDDVDFIKVLGNFGSRTKYVILGDAAHVSLDVVKQIHSALKQNSDFILIGISAAPANAIGHSVDIQTLMGAFNRNLVEIDDDDPIMALQKAGEADQIQLYGIKSPLAKLDGADDPVGLSESVAVFLSEHAERNKMLLDELLRLSSDEDRIVFYASTSMQARMFASLLSLKGKPAMALTNEMVASQRSVEITRFNTDPHMQLLCVHGTLVSSEKLEKVTAVVIGKPIVSGAVLFEVVGRLASSRKKMDRPIKIYAVRDPVPQYLNLIDNLNTWDRLSVGG